VRFIKRAQRFGLRLDDISDLLRIREEGSCPCGHTRQLLADRLTQLDAELAELGRLRGDVARMLTDPGQLRGDDQTCGGTPILARDTPTARRPPMTGTTTCQCGCSPADRTAATTTGGCQCGCAAAATSGIAPGGPCSCGCGDSPPSPQEEIVDLQRRRAQIDERLDELGSES
jgi:DNA-binding transcriptional MerR regulator